MSVTGGLDVGARSIKMAILSHRGADSAVLAKAVVRISGRCGADGARTAIRQSWRQVLAEASLSVRDVDNIASTGSAARNVARVGHLYGHSGQALGARLLFPDATVALEADVDQIHCVLLRANSGRTRRTASDEPTGALAHRAVVHDEPWAPSAGAPLPECLATRAAILLRSITIDGKVVLTGGMVLDAGFVQRLWSQLRRLESNVSLLISPDAIFAGAYGAAILAARRVVRISRSFVDPPVPRIPNRSDRSSLN
jgi:benzoyl-CoA reductase subunit D